MKYTEEVEINGELYHATQSAAHALLGVIAMSRAFGKPRIVLDFLAGLVQGGAMIPSAKTFNENLKRAYQWN